MSNKKDYSILLQNKINWTTKKYFKYEIFFRGFIFGLSNKSFTKIIIENLIKKKNYRYFKKNYGNFAIIIASKKEVLVVTDSARSYPIFYSKLKKHIIISDSTNLIKQQILNPKIHNDIKTLALMSGYTISKYTLYKNIFCSGPSQYIKINKNITNKYYINYFQKNKNNSYTEKKKEYLSILDNIFLDLKKKIKDQKIYLALSAGDDSKLVACYLKKYNFNFECFSYGLRNNWEAKIAKQISLKLGIKHRNIIIESDKVKNFFKSSEFKKYFSLYNNYDSTPSIHELYAIKCLNKFSQKNSIIINGQPADGINGSYIKDIFLKKNTKKIAIDEIIKKHYSLWPKLLDSKNLGLIRKYVMEDINNYHKKIKSAHQILLFHSYQNRICKYLMKNYQVYEFYGYKWFSPYMDLRFLEFWFSKSIDDLCQRNLSKKILKESNFMGVWDKDYIKDNNFNFVNKLLRSMTKVFFIGKKKNWKSFDKKFFQYHSDNQLKSHIVSEQQWKNSDGFRNAISFLSEKWIKESIN